MMQVHPRSVPITPVPSILALTAALAVQPLAAQGEVIHYKFDSADATQVANHADGAAAGPRFGATSWPADRTYAAGRHGTALQHSGYVGLVGNFVDTGFHGPVQGSMTIAFALRNGIANTPTAYSPIAGQPGWSIATGGSAGSGLQLSGTGVGDLAVTFALPICSMTGWNHFAVVVDAAAGTATWYHGGAAVASSPIAGSVAIAAQQQPLLVGTDYVTWCGSMYHLDEFRLLERAATAAEIAAWAAGVTATAVTFGTVANGPDLQCTGRPVLGNTAFAVRATTAAPSLIAFARGTSYSTMGAQALPLDLGALLPAAAGQLLLVAPDFVDLAVAAAGEAVLALPVPNDPALEGLTLAMQAAALDAAGQVTTGNGLLLGVGRD